MRGYLKNAACNGRRPKKVGPQRLYSRPRLVNRLVSERSVARFVIAPSGFGKTSLGLAYASSIFGFRGVHWVDCQSPSFLRELDAETIASDLKDVPGGAALVVFDDVPYLDDVRTAQFSAEIDAILDLGCEVLAITTPAFGAFADAQRDSVVLGARDLLVDDAEIVASRVEGAEGLRECDRVPAFLWGDDSGMRDFLRGMRPGEMPAEMRAPVFVMEALQSGSFDDLAVVSGGVRSDAQRFISEHYPYVGVDLADETFEAHGLEISQVVEGLGDSLDSLGRASTPPARDALSAKVACMLVSRGLGDRACDVMREACARKRRISWLVCQQWPLFDAGCVRPAQDLFDSLGARTAGIDASMVVAAAARLVMLDDASGAAALAKRAQSMTTLTDSDSFACSLIALLAGDGDAAAAARKYLAMVASGEKAVADLWASSIAESALALSSGDVPAACGALGGLAVSDVRPRAASLYIALLLNRLSPADAASFGQPAVAAAKMLLEAIARQHAEACVAEALLLSGLARCGQQVDHPLDRIRACDSLLVSIAAQRRASAAKRSCAPATGRSARTLDAPPAIVPEMRIKVFGGMEVSIGGEPVDPKAFANQRTKTLLAVLTLFRGKEVPRGELLRIMWPGFNEQRATNNFYSLWCKLRRALGSGKADECPYLVRHRTSVMLDARYVKTDVEEFESLYRTLMFEEPNARAWMAVFERMEEDFSCDLLPSEVDNRFIGAMRQKYKARRVDAYVAAAMRLVDAGEASCALWFANAALEAAPGREDAYYAAMRAQAASGQRVQAMETYRACDAYLAEHLGIDPSERMAALYAELLEGR